jgi:DNA polymerase I-like protein with 3'-5' exonuclease and polymerase domains
LPYVKGLARLCEKVANRRGWIRTLCGRVCHFPIDGEGNFLEAYKALNRLIQGGAASQTKKAMVEVDRAGLEPRMQVHDEINFSFDKPKKQAAQAQEIMQECVPLRVPSRVDVTLGPNWREAA